MAIRFVLRTDADGSHSIVDIFTGLNARYAGRELTRIPTDMAASGLDMLNALDEAERENHDVHERETSQPHA